MTISILASWESWETRDKFTLENYIENIRDKLADNPNNYAWSGWTISLADKSRLKELQNELNESGSFDFYICRDKEVHYRLKCIDFQRDHPKSSENRWMTSEDRFGIIEGKNGTPMKRDIKIWFKIGKIEMLIPKKKPSDFKCISSKKSMTQCPKQFSYVRLDTP